VSARVAGLRYVADAAKGIRRVRREAIGSEFTAKDFRTWGGTLLATFALRDEPLESAERRKKSPIKRAFDESPYQPAEAARAA